VLRLNLLTAIGERQYVTRMRALMAPIAMQSDVVIVPGDPKSGQVRNVRRLALLGGRRTVTAGVAAPSAVIALFCAAGWLLRRRRRISAAGLIALACTLTAMI